MDAGTESGLLKQLGASLNSASKQTDSTDVLLSERAKTHGSFDDHARITQALKEVMRRERTWEGLTDPQREALDMVVHKIGRVLAGNAGFKDHWDDIAGYARLVAARCE